MDAKDQRGFHQAKEDVSHTNHSGHLHRHNYVQKGAEVLYHPQKRLRGSRDNDREEAAEQAATQTNISTENTNTHTTRPDVQLMEHPQPRCNHCKEPSHVRSNCQTGNPDEKANILQIHRPDQEQIQSDGYKVAGSQTRNNIHTFGGIKILKFFVL